MAVTLPGWGRPWVEHSGIEWPDVDEDELTRQMTAWTAFADAAESQTHVATSAVSSLMAENWTWGLQAFQLWFQRVSGPSGHMPTCSVMCRVVASALGLASGYVVALKIAVLASLPALGLVYRADQPGDSLLQDLAEGPAALARAEVEVLRSLIDVTVSNIEGLGVDVAAFVGDAIAAPATLLSRRPIHHGRERIGGHLGPITERLHHAAVWDPAVTGKRKFPDRHEPNGVLKRYAKHKPSVLESYAEYDSEGYLLRRVDLRGHPHASGGVPVAPPHTQFYDHHESGGEKFVHYNSTDVRPATPEEIP